MQKGGKNMAKDQLPATRRISGLPQRGAEDDPFFAIQREINRMFDDFFRGDELAPLGAERELRTFSPAIDVQETDKGVTVTAELPGLDEKDVEVTLGDGTLTVRGEKKEEREERGKQYRQREMSYGAFNRVIRLPDGIDTEKVDARFKNGILTITAPWIEEAETKSKKIPIKTQ